MPGLSFVFILRPASRFYSRWLVGVEKAGLKPFIMWEHLSNTWGTDGVVDRTTSLFIDFSYSHLHK